MSPTSENVLDAALALSESERLEIAEALIVSVQCADSFPMSEAWEATIRRRTQEVVEGTVTLVSWDEVKKQAREQSRDSDQISP